MTSEERKRCSTITLEEFPGYTCYLFAPISFNTDFRQEFFDKRSVSLKYANNYMSAMNTSECCVIPNRLTTISKFGPGACYSNDILLIHPKSGIPRTLTSFGTVYNERGTSTPTKIVVPDNYPNCMLRNWAHDSCMLLFVNDDAKLVFAVTSYTTESAIGGSLSQWKSAFYDSPEIFSDFSEFIDGFTMPFGTKLFTIICGLSDLDKALIWGTIPSECIIHEYNIPVGIEPLTVDMLYSAYTMMQSPDNQIVETAFNMLARSKYAPLKYLIKWLLNRNSAAMRYRNKSTAFKWMYSQCCENTGALLLPNEHYKKVATELIRKITNNGIDFDPDGTMKVNEPKWLQDDKIRSLASKI